ncbi:FecR family protein [Salegentibacter echinorum]|uniref:FecR family protein n=1 Tax=Salegentibacter echinorum TaxID=1073325 RepID=A0A1M5GFV0_SALEC|nr:FecR domain-containing protein [Salegentibacter echinorum]SHG02593.1 FecR family protein [Salegentibacter echinorum]
MTDKKYIDNLFNKLVNNQLTEEEYNKLINIIERADHEEEIKQFLEKYLKSEQVLKNITSERNDDDVEKLFSRVIDGIEDEKNVLQSKKWNLGLEKNTTHKYYRVAAVLILLVGVFYFFKNDFIPSQKPAVVNTTNDVENITLKLANGEVRVISQSGKKDIIGEKGSLVASQNGRQLNYANKNDSKDLVYNELSVPYGKRFDLVLADGTQVTLNAGSSIKYPTRFAKAGNRKVYLKGEAYFDVVEDKVRPFIVNTGVIDVEVLGTQFNVSHYPEDTHINTVLVEGSVKIYEENNKEDETSSRLLTPGHMAAWDNEKKKMTVEKVDVSAYIAWKQGVMEFNNISFHEIRKKLERHFNVEIENKNQFLENQVYTATFKEESLEEILNAFREDTPFKYEVSKNKIVITSN